MRIVLNELSLVNGNTAQVKSWYDIFFNTCISLSKELKSNIAIISTQKPSEVTLNADMVFHKWLSTNSNKDIRLMIISMLTKAPLLLDYPYYSFDDQNAKGLGFAFENDLLPISLNSNAMWQNSELQLKLEYLDEVSDSIITDDVNVKHAWDRDSGFNHLPFLKKQLLQNSFLIINELESGQDLWNKRGELFPQLSFCSSIQNQIKNLSGIILHNLINRLVEMNNYFSDWAEGDFDRLAISGNPRLESSTRLQKFNNELSIECTDNTIRVFSFHCNYGIRGGRIHFFPDTENRICWIGYVGSKLV